MCRRLNKNDGVFPESDWLRVNQAELFSRGVYAGETLVRAPPSGVESRNRPMSKGRVFIVEKKK